MIGQIIDCKTDKQFLLDDPGVHANDHQTHALGHRKKTRAVGDHELHVETELPERLQQAIHGQIDTGIFNFRRRISSWRGHTTSSNSFFCASSSKTYFKQIRAKHQYSLISPKTRIAKHADARQLDDQADRHEIAERCGVMMTADHEGIQHYPCKTQPAQETQRSLRPFSRPKESTRSTSTSNSFEFIKACEEPNWNHERSSPQGSETNETAERQCWFSLDCKKAGGQKPWSVILIFEMCKTY